MFMKKRPPMPGTVSVATVYNPVDATIIKDLLAQANIPTIKRPKHGIDPLPTLAGSSVFGEEIYVPCEAEEEARAIIAAFTQSPEGTVFPEDTQGK